MSKKRRVQKNDPNATGKNTQPQAPAESPRQAPYTIDRMLLDYEGARTGEATRTVLKIGTDQNGNPTAVDQAGTEIDIEATLNSMFETGDLDNYEQLRESVEIEMALNNIPDLMDWPNPGNLAPNPDSETTTVLAYVDTLTSQAEFMVALANEAEAMDDTNHTIALINCVSSKIDWATTIFDDYQQTSTEESGTEEDEPEPNDPEHSLQDRLENANEQAEQAFGYAIQSMEADPQAAPDDETIGHLIRAYRIRANTEAMRRCQHLRRTETGEDVKLAYQSILFDLYHNTEEQQADGWDPEEIYQAAPAEQALEQGREIREQELEEFNRNLPVELDSCFDGFPDPILEQLKATPVEPIGFNTGITLVPESLDPQGPPTYLSHVAFYHEGRKYVNGITAAYPLGYPKELAAKHLTGHLQLEHPNPVLGRQTKREILVAIKAATQGLHSVTNDRLQTFAQKARESKLSNAQLHDLYGYVTEYDEELYETMSKISDVQTPLVSRKKARQVIDFARKTGIGAFHLKEIALAMDWHEVEKLGLHAHKITVANAIKIQNAARAAGFDESAVEQIEDWCLMQSDDGTVEC